jgi:hypothetical protein
MNKVHEYRGYKFNIKVELNYKVEKRIDGKRAHKVTLNDLGASYYYETKLTETCALEENIQLMIDDAQTWVDKREDGSKTFEEKLLASLGFN